MICSDARGIRKFTWGLWGWESLGASVLVVVGLDGASVIHGHEAPVGRGSPQPAPDDHAVLALNTIAESLHSQSTSKSREPRTIAPPKSSKPQSPIGAGFCFSFCLLRGGGGWEMPVPSLSAQGFLEFGVQGFRRPVLAHTKSFRAEGRSEDARCVGETPGPTLGFLHPCRPPKRPPKPGAFLHGTEVRENCGHGCQSFL